jgi:hypothetical protein
LLLRLLAGVRLVCISPRKKGFFRDFLVVFLLMFSRVAPVSIRSGKNRTPAGFRRFRGPDAGNWWKAETASQALPAAAMVF